jgi:hypothetical protein
MMLDRKKMLLLFLLVSMLSAGCARRVPFDMGLGPVHGPDDIVEKVNANTGRMHTLRAEAHVWSANTPTSRLATISVRFTRPNWYKVKFGALFGMTMAVVTLRQEEVNIYLPQSNRLYQGHSAPEKLGRILGLDMSLADLMETLVGTVWLPPVSQLLEYRSEEPGHVLSFRLPQGKQQVLVAPDGLRVLKVELFDIQGSCVLMKTFDDYRLVDGIVRPGRVRIVLPDREEEFQLTFTHQEANRPIPEREFRLDLPARVEVVPLDLE